MKILLLNTDTSYSSRQILKQAKNTNHLIKEARYQDIEISFNHGPKKAKIFQITTKDNTPLSAFDAIIARGPMDFQHVLQIITFYCREYNIILLNHDTLEHYPIFDKSIQYALLSIKNLPILPTILDKKSNSFTKLSNIFGKPFIYKYTKGFAGKNVYKIDNSKSRLSIKNFNEAINQRYFIAQQYQPANFDLRIIVIGKQVIGAMKRSAAKIDEFRTNYSLGGNVEKYPIDHRLKKLSLAAAKACRCDYAGIDIIFWQNKPYILEVNRYFHFGGFDKVYQTSVAEKIIRYLEKKYEKK